MKQLGVVLAGIGKGIETKLSNKIQLLLLMRGGMVWDTTNSYCLFLLLTLVTRYDNYNTRFSGDFE